MTTTLVAAAAVPAPAPDYVGLDEAARRLSVSRRGLHRLLRRLGVPVYYPTPRRAVVRLDELDAAVRSTRREQP